MSRSLRPSRRAVLGVCLGAAIAAAHPAAAQQQIGSVAVVDQERLFRESAFGRQLLSEIDARGDVLAAENREIEANLTEEERELTEARATLDQAEFRERARAFDEKVRRLRGEQDAKARALANRQEEARTEFVRGVSPILSDMMSELNVDVLLDRRTVLTARSGVDITDRAVARIDAALPGEDAAPAAETSD